MAYIGKSTPISVEDTVSKSAGGTFGGDVGVTGTLTATSFSGSGLGLSDIIFDTTPQLGGNLDANTKNITNIGTVTSSGYTATSSGSGTVDGLIITNSDTANNGLSIGVDSSENAFIWNGSNTELRFATNNSQKMVIDENGNVGIGVSPSNPGWARNLHVHGAGNGGGLQLTDNTSGSGNDDGLDIASYQGTAFIINRENADIRFHTNDTERFRFASSGQLGIGGATYGTSGQVLTSGGASAAPTWADAGGGGAYELIQKQTISSNVTSISFNSITAPQEQLLLLFNQVTIDATNHIRFNYKDSGYNHLTGTSAYSSASLYHDASGAGVQGGSSSYNFATLTPGLHVKDGTAFSASYYFSGWGTSTPFFEGVATYKNSSANNSFARSAQAVGYYGSGTPTRIYIYTSANYFTGGEIYLYKLV